MAKPQCLLHHLAFDLGPWAKNTRSAYLRQGDFWPIENAGLIPCQRHRRRVTKCVIFPWLNMAKPSNKLGTNSDTLAKNMEIYDYAFKIGTEPSKKWGSNPGRMWCSAIKTAQDWLAHLPFTRFTHWFWMRLRKSSHHIHSCCKSGRVRIKGLTPEEPLVPGQNLEKTSREFPDNPPEEYRRLCCRSLGIAEL